MSTGTKEIPSAQRPAPQMPSACGSGGCGCGSGGDAGAARKPGTATVTLHRRRGADGSPAFEQAWQPVQVNGVTIPPEAIAQEGQQHPAPDPAAAWLAAARALAIRELLLQEAVRLGLAARPEADAQGRLELDEEALIRALLETEAAPAPPSEEECRRVYDSQARRFSAPELFEAGHILVEPGGDDDAAWEQARLQAQALADAVGDDPQAFAAAAQAHSGCPSAQQGGSLGQLQRGDLVPVVQAAIEALPPGTTGRTPVRSRFGWHVLRLERRIPGRTLPFELVRGRIVDMLEARAWALAAMRYTAGLAARASIVGVQLAPADVAAELAP